MAIKSKPKPAPKKKTLAQRIAADPALKAKYLSNPGLRSKLPASALTPAQRKTREANAYAKAPITDGSSITNRQLSLDARNATQIRYGGDETALKTQQTQTAQQGKETAGWYDMYRQELAQHAATVQNIGGQAVAQDQGLQEGIRGLDQQQSTDQTAAMTNDATLRGQTIDPATAQRDSQASVVRQSMIASSGAAQASTNAANNVYADSLANVIAPGRKLAAGRDNQSKLDALAAQMADLANTKGAYAADYRSGRVQDEQKNILANRIAGANVVDDQAKNAIATTSAVNSDANTKTGLQIRRDAAATTAATNASRLNKYGYTTAEWQGLSEAQRKTARVTGRAKVPKAKQPVTGPGSLTPGQEQAKLSDVRKVLQRLQNPTKTKVDPITGVKSRVPATKAEALKELVGGDTDPDLLILARSLDHYKGKGIGPQGVAAAHRLGIHVGPNFKIIRTATKAKAPTGLTATSKVGNKPPVPGLKP